MMHEIGKHSLLDSPYLVQRTGPVDVPCILGEVRRWHTHHSHSRPPLSCSPAWIRADATICPDGAQAFLGAILPCQFGESNVRQWRNPIVTDVLLQIIEA